MTDTPVTPDAALARLRLYGERTSTWSTATYNDGTEKALHQIAVSLASEVERLRGELSDATAELAENARAMNALRRHRDTAEAEAANLKQRIHEARMAPVWTNEDGKRFVFADDLRKPLLGTTPPRGVALLNARAVAEAEATP